MYMYIKYDSFILHDHLPVIFTCINWLLVNKSCNSKIDKGLHISVLLAVVCESNAFLFDDPGDDDSLIGTSEVTTADQKTHASNA